MIYVVRHGHTDWNKQKITMGRKDISLNDIGIEEAYNTSKALKNYSFDLIICSSLLRARQTAEIINKNRNNKIIYDDRIMERNLGDLEGKPYTYNNSQIWDININDNSNNIETMEDLKIEYIIFLMKF